MFKQKLSFFYLIHQMIKVIIIVKIRLLSSKFPQKNASAEITLKSLSLKVSLENIFPIDKILKSI